MKCKCKEIYELHGEDAQKYIGTHLEFVPFPGKTNNNFYKCPLTGITWYTEIDANGVLILINFYVSRADKVIACRCDQINELWDSDAIDYIHGHLQIKNVDDEKWQVFYSCPKTGKIWVEERPDSKLHGGGPIKLRQI
jgi:hypothetical protein